MQWRDYISDVVDGVPWVLVLLTSGFVLAWTRGVLRGGWFYLLLQVVSCRVFVLFLLYVADVGTNFC